MSQENVECVRRLMEAFNDGDVDALIAECDSDVEWEEQSIPGVDAVFRGHDGVRSWAGLVMGQELRSLEGRIERIEEVGDAVVASVVIHSPRDLSDAY